MMIHGSYKLRLMQTWEGEKVIDRDMPAMSISNHNKQSPALGS